ncbi:hypothetical protein GTW67_32235 [Streptomyces sp. SID5910]|nr:hypothetical protein [Streptomyces sp. SID5910]
MAQAADDFDAFFAEEVDDRPRHPFTLYGKRYTLPESMPLMFTLGMERLQHSSNPDDIRKMLRPLFGRDTLDEWAEHGMTDRQFAVVLIYSAANIRTPGALTMQGAADAYDRQEAAKAGKAATPNRAARRKKGKRKTASSGRR